MKLLGLFIATGPIFYGGVLAYKKKRYGKERIELGKYSLLFLLLHSFWIVYYVFSVRDLFIYAISIPVIISSWIACEVGYYYKVEFLLVKRNKEYHIHHSYWGLALILLSIFIWVNGNPIISSLMWVSGMVLN